MMKAGLIEEMMDDVMDSVNDTEEEEVDEEVEKVLLEVAGEQISELPDAGRTKVEPEKTEAVHIPKTPCQPGYLVFVFCSHCAGSDAGKAARTGNVACSCCWSDA